MGKTVLLAGLLASSIVSGVQAAVQVDHAVPPASGSEISPVSGNASEQPVKIDLSRGTKSIGKWNSRINEYYKKNWGVEVIGVRPISSGYMLQFRYRVVDKNKAYVLNNKKAKPYLIDEATGNVLGVPTMEKVGELRQTPAFKDNQAYFIIFGNPGALVKSGGTVSIVVDSFRINGLVVE